jgi:hypothetical protein
MSLSWSCAGFPIHVISIDQVAHAFKGDIPARIGRNLLNSEKPA